MIYLFTYIFTCMYNIYMYMCVYIDHVGKYVKNQYIKFILFSLSVHL